MWANLCKKSLRNVAIPLAGDNLSTLVSSLTCNAQNKFEKKISGKGAVRARIGFTFFFQMKIWMILLKS